MATMTIRYHEGDISETDAQRYVDAVAMIRKRLGLVPHRDRLCVVQLSPGDGTADVIRIAAGQKQDPLCSLLADASKQKIFHYGRFDIAVLFHSFGVTTENIFCTKIASRLTRTYTDRHGLKDNLKNCWRSIFPRRSSRQIGPLRPCRRHSWNMLPLTCFICTHCVTN